MNNLKEVPIADLKAALDFTREQILEQEKLNSKIDTTSTVKHLKAFEDVLTTHLIIRTSKLRNYKH